MLLIWDFVPWHLWQRQAPGEGTQWTFVKSYVSFQTRRIQATKDLRKCLVQCLHFTDVASKAQRAVAICPWSQRVVVGLGLVHSLCPWATTQHCVAAKAWCPDLIGRRMHLQNVWKLSVSPLSREKHMERWGVVCGTEHGEEPRCLTKVRQLTSTTWAQRALTVSLNQAVCDPWLCGEHLGSDMHFHLSGATLGGSLGT